jgi:hypothetical protein
LKLIQLTRSSENRLVNRVLLLPTGTAVETADIDSIGHHAFFVIFDVKEH